MGVGRDKSGKLKGSRRGVTDGGQRSEAAERDRTRQSRQGEGEPGCLNPCPSDSEAPVFPRRWKGREATGQSGHRRKQTLPTPALGFTIIIT